MPAANNELSNRFDLACQIASSAGALAMRYFREPHTYAIHTKGLQDQASDADRAVEELIKARLEAEFPHDAWLGEETGRRGDGEAGFAWVVDPIDGTQCFINGIPIWCVSIAILSEGRPVAGVVYDPNADEVFTACRNRGAFAIPKPGYFWRKSRASENEPEERDGTEAGRPFPRPGSSFERPQSAAFSASIRVPHETIADW